MQIFTIISCNLLGVNFNYFYITLNIVFSYQGISNWLNSLIEPLLGGNTSQFALSIYLIIAIILLQDFKSYAVHYICHKNPFFDLHEFHHSPTEMTILSQQKVIIILLGHFESIVSTYYGLAPLAC